MRLASPVLILPIASIIASLPVEQAEEFEVTWLPTPRRPEIRALVPLSHHLFDNTTAQSSYLTLIN